MIAGVMQRFTQDEACWMKGYAPFARASREDDYRVAWAFFEAVQ